MISPKKAHEGEYGVSGGVPQDGLQAVRLRYAAQGRPRKAQIFPCLSFVGQVAQQVGRMVGHDQRNAVVAMNPSAKARDRRFRVQQSRRRALAQGDDELGLDQGDLAIQLR